VAEVDEANNCVASATAVQIGLPDVLVVSVTSAQQTVQRGKSLSVSDTVVNSGTMAAGDSKTRQYLSKDGKKGPGDILLAGGRSTGGLAPATSSGGTVTVTVPAGVTPAAYYLLACADDLHVVKESDETNNCKSAANKVTVTQ
jgi:hypothetical protein